MYLLYNPVLISKIIEFSFLSFCRQKYVKYVRNLLSITASGDHCVLATRADDSSGQVVQVKFSVTDNLSRRGQGFESRTSLIIFHAIFLLLYKLRT